jgi:hypothetical protein
MEFAEKSKIILDRWISHSDHHLEEYEGFADELEGAGKAESAKAVREMAELTSKGAECLKRALKALD